MPKLVMVGAASAVFGLKMLRDVSLTPELKGWELMLVDVNEEGLELMRRTAERLSRERNFPLKIGATTDRAEALRGAGYVIVSVSREKDRLWKLDFTVPMAHGIKHTLGENGGIGGLFHTLRSVWLVMGIVKDIERLAPDAWVLNFSNPMSRVCMAISKHSRLRFVGLCHGLLEQRHRLGEYLGIPTEETDFLASGLNHFTWVHEMKRASTGEDIYPLLRERLKEAPADFLPLCRFLFESFGLFPCPGDGHVGEYLPYAMEFTPPRDIRRFDTGRWRNSMTEKLAKAAEGKLLLEEVAPASPSGELAIEIIAALETGKERRQDAVNIPNRGYMPGLPEDAIVEVPARISRGRIEGIKMPRLPEGVMALLAAQVNVQRMAVEAAMTGDRKLALEAVLSDPAVPTAKGAKAAFDELMRLEADYLPQFA